MTPSDGDVPGALASDNASLRARNEALVRCLERIVDYVEDNRLEGLESAPDVEEILTEAHGLIESAKTT